MSKEEKSEERSSSNFKREINKKIEVRGSENLSVDTSVDKVVDSAPPRARISNGLEGKKVAFAQERSGYKVRFHKDTGINILLDTSREERKEDR